MGDAAHAELMHSAQSVALPPPSPSRLSDSQHSLILSVLCSAETRFLSRDFSSALPSCFSALHRLCNCLSGAHSSFDPSQCHPSSPTSACPVTAPLHKHAPHVPDVPAITSGRPIPLLAHGPCPPDPAHINECLCIRGVTLMIQLLYETGRANEIIPFVHHFYGRFREMPVEIVQLCVELLISQGKLEAARDALEEALESWGGMIEAEEKGGRERPYHVAYAYSLASECLLTRVLVPLGAVHQIKRRCAQDRLIPEATASKILAQVADKMDDEEVVRGDSVVRRISSAGVEDARLESSVDGEVGCEGGSKAAERMEGMKQGALEDRGVVEPEHGEHGVSGPRDGVAREAGEKQSEEGTGGDERAVAALFSERRDKAVQERGWVGAFKAHHPKVMRSWDMLMLVLTLSLLTGGVAWMRRAGVSPRMLFHMYVVRLFQSSFGLFFRSLQ